MVVYVTSEGEIVLLENFFVYLSYGMYLILTVFSITIGSSFLSGGIRLVTFNMKLFEQKLSTAMYKLQMKTNLASRRSSQSGKTYNTDISLDRDTKKDDR